MTDLGHFAPVPDPGGTPHGVLFYATEDGRDFYDMVASEPPGDAFFLVDASGHVVSASGDLSALSPHDLRVIAMEDGGTLLAAHDRGEPLAWDGEAIVPYTLPLNEVRAAALVEIDVRAEAARQRYITSGDGMALVYGQKQKEAALFLADGTAGLLLTARAARLSTSPAAVAGEWTAKAEAWLAAAVTIEDIREAAKEAVMRKRSAESIQAVLEGLSFPSPKEEG